MIRLPFDPYPFIRPILFRIDSEVAHGLAMACLKRELCPVMDIDESPVLHTAFKDHILPHPIGLAAGFDKHAEVIQQLFHLGFSFAEIGGVTPLPQPGNPKPRMFRIPEAKAIINRFNFNSVGHDVFLRHLQAWYDATSREEVRPVVGVNLACGDHCTDEAEAFISGLKKFAPYVRFITINVSCPNEACARHLEGKDQLERLLHQVMDAHAALAQKPLLFIKISPDQTEQQARDIAAVASAAAIDGMIVGNTTTARPASIQSPHMKERGGLSGKPLFGPSTKLLGEMYQLTGGKIPLIGCGGVFTGADAYAKICAGATLVQVYTAMVYEGPAVVHHIVKELAELLTRDGFSSVNEAVGSKFRKK